MTEELEPITISSERLHQPYVAHPSEIIGWLQAIVSRHEPTGELQDPRIVIDENGLLATWTTKGHILLGSAHD